MGTIGTIAPLVGMGADLLKKDKPSVVQKPKAEEKQTTSIDEKNAKGSDPSVSESINYLDEKRGKTGTIKTSWQGLLTKDENLPKRKTLLGE